MTVWPVEEPDALNPATKDVLLLAEFAFVNTHGAVRFAVETPARVTENVDPPSVMVPAADAPVSSFSSTVPVCWTFQFVPV